MPLTPDLRYGLDRIRDHLYGGYPNPAQNAEQLSFLIFFYMFEAADAARIRAADFNLSAGRYRPQNRARVEHRDPLEILDELRAMEREILAEIDELADAVREAVGGMSAYPRVPLGEICTINPRIERSGIPEEDMLVSFVPMAAVDERSGMITACEDRRLGDVSKGFTAFEDGDVLFAKITPCMENGKAALARNLFRDSSYST